MKGYETGHGIIDEHTVMVPKCRKLLDCEERLEMDWPIGKWFEVEYAENAIVDILSRLPANLLLSYKLVCKHWREVISSQILIDSQLLWSRKHPAYIVYPYMDSAPELYLMHHDEITRTITFPDGDSDNLPPLAIISSFDGLLCCINRRVEDETDLEIRLCNPVTGKFLLLPKGSPSQETPSIGVALGAQINEYKVFRLFYAKHHPNGQCEVYSSRTRSWRNIGDVPHLPMCSSHSPLGSNHVAVGGNLYWFVASKRSRIIPDFILTVDIIKENFKTIKLPRKVTEHSYLIDFEGDLGLVVVYEEDEVMNIWSFSGEEESRWRLKCSEEVPFSNEECVEFVAAKEKEIFLVTSNHYFIYDSGQMSWREIDLSSVSDKRQCPVTFAYTESLLSCSGRLDPYPCP